MRPAEVVRRAADYLARHDVDGPLITAEVLLANVLGTDRVGLYARGAGLSSVEARRFGRALCRRCGGTPTQHLTGEQGFRRLVLQVVPGVFVPRPETEVLVEVALGLLDGLDAPTVVDVGTGTGAVALAIGDERPDARVLATDLSPEAVDLARANAARLGIAVEVLVGDLLAPVPEDLRGGIDLVVANPPYVALEEADRLPVEVRAEPPLAVFGGIDVYERLFEQAWTMVRPGGAVAVEIEETMGPAVVDAAAAAGFTEDVAITPDLVGRPRVVRARRP